MDSKNTAMVIAGDFNAHLGTLAGPRGSGPPNQRGFALKDFIDRNELFVASHCSLSHGPSYTYHSGRYFSTIDYIIVNGPCSSLLTSCQAITDHPLNISDHIPLSLSLNVVLAEDESVSTPVQRVHWEKAVSSDAVRSFAKRVDDNIQNYLNTHLDDEDDLDGEVEAICKSIICISSSTLPTKIGGKKRSCNFFNDEQLGQLCKASKKSWSEWSMAGRPVDGPLFERKNADKKNVRNKLNQLQARKERQNAELLDKMFKKKDRRRFNTPKQSPSGTRLLIDDTVVSDPSEVSTEWAAHFEQLGSTKVMENPALQELQSKITMYQSCSLQNEDFVLDTEIEIVEIEAAIAKLKPG